MLCAIRASDNKKVLASDEIRTNRPFYCPRCRDEAILKKGSIKIHHFAHRPPVTCEYGKGETEQHRRCKLEIFEGLKEHRRFRQVELEKDMGTVRPDVSALMDDTPIAIEVQISALSMDRIIYRTLEYAKKGIYVLWLPIYNIDLDSDRYSPTAWEKWIHAAYYGRVYYWIDGVQILPYHFSESTHFVETRHWYNQYGDEEAAGGYEKRYKRYRTPMRGRSVTLSQSFDPRYRRDPWRSKTLFVPESRLLIDTQPNWWKK